MNAKAWGPNLVAAFSGRSNTYASAQGHKINDDKKKRIKLLPAAGCEAKAAAKFGSRP